MAGIIFKRDIVGGILRARQIARIIDRLQLARFDADNLAELGLGVVESLLDLGNNGVGRGDSLTRLVEVALRYLAAVKQIPHQRQDAEQAIPVLMRNA